MTTLWAPMIAPSPTVTPFMMVDPMANPGIFADPHRPNFLRLRRLIRDSIGNIPRVPIGIHERNTRSDIHIILDYDLFVDNKQRAMANIHAIPDSQSRLVENSPAEDIHFPKKIDVVTQVDLGMPNHERHLREREALPDRFAAAPKERLTIEIVSQPAEEGKQALMSGIEGAKTGIQKKREWKICRLDSPGQIV